VLLVLACRGQNGRRLDEGVATASRAPSSSEARLPVRALGTRAGRAGSVEPVWLEQRPARDSLDTVAPPEHPNQRVAFSRGRLAWLDGDELRVFELEGFRMVTQFRSADARNVVGLTGGGFLIAARDHVQRLSDLERRPELFPRAPRIGPTTIFPSRHESEQFWLYFEGIDRLPRFDLGAPPRVASLPILDSTELVAFDRRALLGLGDGSFIYTTPDGLRRIDVEGRPEHLPQPELAGRVWALGRDSRLDRVWAATEQHLYLVHARERASTLVRLEIAPHPVALAAEEGRAALLSVESMSAEETHLRIDVYTVGAERPPTVHLQATRPSAGDAGSEPELRPEIALDAAHDLVAVNAFGLQVWNFRRGVRVYPPDPAARPEPAAQKLAPGAP
jgi:hypothetical protein